MRLIVFDLDHTLLSVNSSYTFGSFLYQRGYCSPLSVGFSAFCYGLHKMGCLSMTQVHRYIFSCLFAKRSLELLQNAADDFLTLHLTALLSVPVLRKLQEAQKQGESTLLLSSSPDFLVAPIAHRLGISGWESTRYTVDSKNRLSGISHVVQGEDKAVFASQYAERLGIPKESIVFYTDSYLDLPLLEIVGQAICVNPDRRLKALCQQKGWTIL